MDNQNETNNSIQNLSNNNDYNHIEKNINTQNMYDNTNQNFNDANNQQTSYNMNGVPQNTYMINSMIDSLSGWMKFMGIMTIISGALSCLGIITAAIGVPLIFAGIALINCSKNIKTYKQYSNPYILNEVFASLNKYFKIQGILTIVGIIVLIITIIIAVFSIILSFNAFQDYYYYY